MSAHDYLSEYCLMDCVIVDMAIKVLSKTIRTEVGMSMPIDKAITISSMSMYIFKAKYNMKSTPIMSMPLTSAVSGFLSKSYMGGRVEVFNSGIGIDKVYHYDVPGMYAITMTKDLPYGNPVYIRDFTENYNVRKFITKLNSNKMMAFMKCVAEAPKDLHLPVLGVKYDNKLMFPLGTIKGT